MVQKEIPDTRTLIASRQRTSPKFTMKQSPWVVRLLTVLQAWHGALGAVHELVVGSISSRFVYTGAFDDEALTLELIANISTPTINSWIALSVSSRREILDGILMDDSRTKRHCTVLIMRISERRTSLRSFPPTQASPYTILVASSSSDRWYNPSVTAHRHGLEQIPILHTMSSVPISGRTQVVVQSCRLKCPASLIR